MKGNFVAIDFETATPKRDSACQVGIAMVKDGVIAHKWSALIKPPGNVYSHWNTKVHGIKAEDTANAKTFKEIFTEIERRTKGHLLVAHNSPFDESVLKSCMKSAGMDYKSLDVRWECTLAKEKKEGHKKVKLNECCKRYGIELNHHEALSDAVACAKVYLVESSQRKIDL